MKLYIIVGLLALTLFTAKLLLGESQKAEVQSWRSDHRNHRPNKNIKKHNVTYSNSSTIYEWV